MGSRVITAAAPPRLHAAQLSLLPAFGLSVDDLRTEMCPASQRLVAYLALHGGHLPRTVVSGTLWPEVSETRAQACLRSAIWRLAQDAGTSLVGATPAFVWLEPCVRVDLDEASARAHAVLAAECASPGRSELEALLRALSQDVLVGWYEDWALEEQERFRQLRLHALERLGDLLLQSRRPDDAVRVALVAVAAEPLRESAQRLLVRAHVAEGNVAEALRQFRSYAALAAEELRIGPSRQLTDLVDTALASAASPGWSASAVAALPG